MAAGVATDAMADLLLGAGRSTLEFRQAAALFRRARPDLDGAGDFFERLAGELRRLEADGVVVLPKARSGWDRSVVPHQPRTLRVVRPAAAKPERAAVAWAPELAFAAQERNAETRSRLAAVNAWLLANRGVLREWVPVRERSLEIFGAEKLLDDLCSDADDGSGPTLFRGKLPLSALLAFRVEPPLPFVRGAAGRPVLVVENLATFDTLSRWNAEPGSGAPYGAIALGGGAAVSCSWGRIAEIAADAGTDRVLYFGDLDAPGLCILGRLRDRSRRETRFRLDVEDALYRHLAFDGRRVSRSAAPGDLRNALGVLGDCFAEDVAAMASGLLQAKQAVPQEAVTIEVLRTLARM